MSEETETVTESPQEKPQPSVTASGLPIGPQPDISYPVKVLYCGHCSLPTEYCEFYPDFEKCKSWLEKNLPDAFAERFNIDAKGDETEDDKKRQKRGGKGLVKPKKKEEGPKKICLSLSMRGRKKLTVITGLKSCGIDLKVAAKFFGTRFACGSSVTGEDEIVVQGDIKDDLFDILPEKWPEIDEDYIDDLGEVKR